jgi:hypothetical protein
MPQNAVARVRDTGHNAPERGGVCMDVSKREELALQVDETEWEWLRPHLERDVLILVSQDLDLAEVGAKVAGDDAAAISAWIEKRKVGKPSAKQILDWDMAKGKKFLMLVVSPYVLVKEKEVSFLQ